jgi:hypothetical protein
MNAGLAVVRPPSCGWLRAACVGAAAVAAVVAWLPADALARGERVEIIPHGGVRFGGNFRDRLSGEPMNIGASAAAGLTVDIAWDANTELELLYSRQATRLKRDGAAPGSPSFDLDIEYYQIGGTYLFDKSGALQPYFAAWRPIPVSLSPPGAAPSCP